MKLTQVARELRGNSTDAERLFWSKVRAHRLHGYKFKRQQSLGPYVVDFACLEAKLVVELDGGQHANSDRDKVRDAWLQSEGYRVLRFWNNDALTNIDGVLVTVVECLSPSPRPSPLVGEG